jgi:5-methylcytosine-specific restriction endonuclease McrA
LKKRRSDIAKLVSASRDIWRQSENYQYAKKMSKSAFKKGWFNCSKCLSDREVIKIDHIEPIGKQPIIFEEFGDWLAKLFCGVRNLKGLCKDCHDAKTKQERKDGKYK